MGAWICPNCRLHYGEEARQRCPADGERLVLNLSGASVQGHILTHLLHVKPDGSTVWEARAGQDERVALELLRGQQDAAAWALASQLDHPRIAAVKGYATIDDDLACAVMAWIDGEPLTQQLTNGPLPVPTALHLVDQVLDALIYVHDRDSVHGDVQPDTVFFEKKSDAKLVNVGVHRWPPLAEVLGAQGADGLKLHMVAYAPPERLATGNMGPTGDLYSLGAMLWHLLTGAPVFGSDPHVCARAHLTAKRPLLSEAHPERNWPDGLDAFLAQALAPRPADRFESAVAMRAALRPIREVTQPVEVEAPPIVITEAPPVVLTPSPAAVQPPADNPEPKGTAWFWMAGVGLIIISGVLIGRAFVNDEPPTKRPTKTAVATSAPASTPEPVEHVKATPLSAAPVSIASAGSALVAPASIAQAPTSTGPISVASAATPSAAGPQSLVSASPATPASAALVSAPASVAAAPTSTVIEIEPVQVASEPAAPTPPAAPQTAAPEAVAVAAPRTKAAAAKPAKVAKRRRKIVRKNPRKRTVARRTERRVETAPKRRAPPVRDAAPKGNARTSKNGIRILGQ